jgi:putative transposase
MDTREMASEYRLSHWAGILQQRKQSGESVRSFCKSSGIRENVYYYWQRKLREAASESLVSVSGAGNVVQPVPQGWAVCAERTSDTAAFGGAVLEIGKIRVEVGSNVSADQLEKICLVLLRLC